LDQRELANYSCDRKRRFDEIPARITGKKEKGSVARRKKSAIVLAKGPNRTNRRGSKREWGLYVIGKGNSGGEAQNRQFWGLLEKSLPSEGRRAGWKSSVGKEVIDALRTERTKTFTQRKGILEGGKGKEGRKDK